MGIKYPPVPFAPWAAEVFGRGHLSLPVISDFEDFGHLSITRPFWMRNQFRSIEPFSQLFSGRADEDRKGWLKILLVNSKIRGGGIWFVSCKTEGGFNLLPSVISLEGRNLPHTWQHSSSILYLKYLDLVKNLSFQSTSGQLQNFSFQWKKVNTTDGMHSYRGQTTIS